MTASRVLKLPSSEPFATSELEETRALLEKPEGSWSLRPLQLEALTALRHHRGLVGAVGVGEGKTLIAACAGTLVGAERPLLLLPAALRETARREFDLYEPHFHTTPPTLLSYSELSRKDGASRLEALDPDLVVLDECHYLRHLRSGRTKRFARWRAANPDVPVVALSGTLTSKSIRDYAHLLLWALGEGAPAPSRYHVLDAWAAAIDPFSAHRPTTGYDWKAVEPLVRWSQGGSKVVWPFRAEAKRERARVAWFDRLRSAPGVVTTDLSTYDGDLEIGLLDLPTPPEIQEALDELTRSECLPDGFPLISALELARARRQLSQGYYSTFEWGDEGPDWQWLDARSTWSGLCQWQIARGGHLGIDTPGTLVDAIKAGAEGVAAHVVEAYLAWESVESRVDLSELRRVVWLSPALLDLVEEHLPPVGTLVWYSDTAVAEALDARGVHVVWPGEEPPSDASSVALSIWSHGVGKNLQHYSQNFVLSPPPDGQRWEQLLGRTHRPGQKSETVEVAVLAWTPIQRESVARAVHLAWYLQETTGQEQKLLRAKALNFSLDRP